jgi:hypothetical protein
MTDSNLSPVERALRSLKKPVIRTSEDTVSNGATTQKQPKGGWSELARSGEHHKRQTISHK